MTALAKDRNTPVRSGDVDEHPVLAATKIYAGSIVVLDSSGWAKPAATATGLVCVGRAEQQVDNVGANGALKVKVKRGTFRFANSADSDEITRAEIGSICYLVDDQTVAKLATSRSAAGIVTDVDAQGVSVFMGYGPMRAPSGALLAANNLSDVANTATAFSAIKQAATTSATGVSELATSAEQLVGTDTARVPSVKAAADTYAAKFGTPSFVIGADGGTTINVGIQLKDAAGADLAVRGSVFAYLSDDANGDSIVATAPSGGWAIGTDGVLIPVVAGKAAQLVSESDGDIDITITEAGAKNCYLILVMPDGRLVASAIIAFAS